MKSIVRAHQNFEELTQGLPGKHSPNFSLEHTAICMALDQMRDELRAYVPDAVKAGIRDAKDYA